LPEQKLAFPYKPQVNISISSTGRMWIVCACAFLCIIQSSFNDGGKSFLLAITSLFFALLTEFLLTWREYGSTKVKDGSAAATALILVLLLPNEISPVYAALGVIFAIFVVKYSFGGLGSNWLNPALGGWLFIRFSWYSAFEKALENDTFSVTKLNEDVKLSVFDSNFTEFLNHSIFSFFNIQLPSGYIDLFSNNNPGIIADRGLFFLLIGTIAITAAGINRGWIPLVFLAVYGLLIRFAGDLSGLFWNGDLLYGFFSGGTIATAFIISAEPVSSAKLKPGILLSVILGAVLSWFFRYKCQEFFGCFIAIAFINCLTPVIIYFEEKLFLSYKNRDKFQENIL
jgi:electron transport complex protein RnfD